MSQLKPLLILKQVMRAPNGIRTRVTAVKGRCPRPLDDGDVLRLRNLTRVYPPNQTAFLRRKKATSRRINGLVALLLKVGLS
jgi:hypothetical protein